MTDTPIDLDALLAMDDELVFEDDADVAGPPPPAARKPRRTATAGKAAAVAVAAPAATKPAAPAADMVDFDALLAMDDELVFDGGDAEIAPPSPPAPRRKPRRGADQETRPAAVPEPAAEAPAGTPAPLPTPDAAPSDPGPAAAARRDRVPALLAALVALACLTSLIALGATIAIGRTLAAARADRDRAATQAETLARLPAIVDALDRTRARLEKTAAGAATGSPATAADLHAAIDGLRVSLGDRATARDAPIAGTLRDGFSELDAHLGRIEDRLPAKGR